MDSVILEQEALLLSAGDRVLLADKLLDSLNGASQTEIDSAWAEESERRLALYRNGKLDAVDGPAAMLQLRKILAE